MIWDKLAHRYDKLWVQKYSLAPTRREIISKVSTLKKGTFKLIDIGCGTGQLIESILNKNQCATCVGIDKSEKMIHQAKNKNLKADFYKVDINQILLKEFLSDKFDVIVCTHSFPYYKNKSLAFKNISEVIKDEGVVIFAQAAINSFYDKVIMSIVESTAEKAEYISKAQFLTTALEYFDIIEQFNIREKWFMPSICGFVMRKKI
ncbi:UNVERIFIED_CONTAM: methyltransferase family protein [Acetivibrio alkalicellulosi]